MSAGFKFDNYVHWGTMGAIETCVEALCEQATEHFGSEDSLTQFLYEWRDVFLTGMTGIVVSLDKALTDSDSRRRFLQIWDAAAQQMLREDRFTEYGREWLKHTTGNLKKAVLNADNRPQ